MGAAGADPACTVTLSASYKDEGIRPGTDEWLRTTGLPRMKRTLLPSELHRHDPEHDQVVAAVVAGDVSGVKELTLHAEPPFMFHVGT